MTADDRRVSELLGYWFGTAPMDASRLPELQKFWFAPDPDRDRAMAQRFEGLVREAESGRLDGWARSARGRLALILLHDQVRRNIFRGSPEAFARDGRARYLMRDGFARQMDLQLSPIERCFFFRPLQHSESLHDQETAVDRYRQLEQEVSDDLRPAFSGFTRLARSHRDVIARFGRFPHRNGILGRLNTPEEQAWLDGSPPDFNQR
jgi:uncharacterized protein (DUF924 family)